MELRNHFTHMALAGGLAAALALGGVPFGASPAYAATTDTGSVTILKNANNTSDATTTIGYQIFTADVVDNGNSKTASNIAWASDEVATVVNGQIKALDSSYGQVRNRV